MQYQLLPELTQDEFATLKADIAKRGVQVPVEYDEQGNILDGHHRLRACEELGIDEWPSIIRGDLSEEEKVEHVLSLNLNRRHLTREQLAALEVDLRQQGWSYRRIGEKLNRSHEQVRRDVQEATVTDVTVEMPDEVVGKDGKTRAATKPTPKPSAIAQNRAKAEEVFANIAEGNGVVVHEPSVASEPTLEPSAPAAHVANNSGDNEWYTPQEYIDAAREVMGGIDLDPASSVVANEVVGATRFFTAEEDGLRQEWHGRVWMNPPYAQPLIGQFVEKLAGAEGVEQAIVLVNNATETQWFQLLGSVASAICFPKGRVKFWAPDKISAPLQGQAILYVGEDAERFCAVFGRFGLVVRV